MKQYEALYIDGQLVNIGTSDITLEWKSVMLSNISKLKVNHSYTIKLPMTANNRRVFEMAEDAPRDAYVFANGVKTPIGRRMSARYYCNGVDVLGNANAYLLGTDKSYYRVVLTWGTLSALQTVIEEERTLPEVFTESGYPTTLYYQQWKTSRISASLGENVMCLRYKTGVIGDAFYGYLYYLPSFKVTWLLDKIFKKYGIKYDLTRPDGKVDSLLDSLYCPMVSMNDSVKYQESAKFKWVFEASATEYGSEYTQLESFSHPFSDRVMWFTRVQSPHNVRLFAGYYLNMAYKVRTHIRVFFAVNRIEKSEAEISSDVKLAIVNGNGKDDASKLLSLTATYISAEWEDRKNSNQKYYEVRYEYDEWQEADGNDTPGNDEWEGWHMGDYKWEDVIEERQGRRVWIDGFDRARFGTESDIDLINTKTGQRVSSYSNWCEFIPIVTEVQPYQEGTEWFEYVNNTPSYLYLEPNFPDMKPIDFLKGIFYIVGAYPVITDETLKLVLYKDLIDNVSKALDWSDYIIGDDALPDNIKFVLDDWNQRNWLRWKDDDEDNPKFSWFFEIDDPYLKQEDDVFTLPFKGCDTKDGMAVVPIYETGKVVNYIKFKNEILWFKNASYAREIAGWVFKEQKPTVGIRKSAYNLSYDQLSGVDGALDYLSFEELSFQTSNGLMSTRYKVFAELLRHPYMITAVFDIDEITLGALDMSIPIYLRQYASYFGITSIKRKSDGKCTVELLRIPNTLITG